MGGHADKAWRVGAVGFLSSAVLPGLVSVVRVVNIVNNTLTGQGGHGTPFNVFPLA
ncbi:hypothetical protein MSL71_31630 [Desulfoluna butyratoxydans]|uniref:Uncharacterized protein n=1 Tax=Desulfoluna butyratoxydans TaxID=231438 RepID=A0A4U8YN51_9BACT|nr:hypothetical protein MSL71_31630 [Desulfoluna butyratoxydans]